MQWTELCECGLRLGSCWPFQNATSWPEVLKDKYGGVLCALRKLGCFTINKAARQWHVVQSQDKIQRKTKNGGDRREQNCVKPLFPCGKQEFSTTGSSVLNSAPAAISTGTLATSGIEPATRLLQTRTKTTIANHVSRLLSCTKQGTRIPILLSCRTNVGFEPP